LLRKHDPGWVKKSIIPPTDTKIQPHPEPGDEWKQEPKEPSENPHDDIAYKILGGLVGARYIDLGLNETDLWKRLNALEYLAKWAINKGYKEMYVV
jgi:hypothetical protein